MNRRQRRRAHKCRETAADTAVSQGSTSQKQFSPNRTLGGAQRQSSPLSAHQIVTTYSALSLWRVSVITPETARTIREIEAADAEIGMRTRFFLWPDGHACVASFEGDGPTNDELISAYARCYAQFIDAPHACSSCRSLH